MNIENLDTDQQPTLEADVADVFGFGPSAPSEPAPATPAPPAPAEPGDAGAPPPPSGTEPASPVPPASAAPATPVPPAAPLPPLAGPAVPAAPTPPAPPAAPTAEELSRASLEAQVQALQAELAASKGTPPAPAPGGGSDDSPEEVKYGLVIPQEVQAALLSEKPEDNVAAITHIINGLAKHVHQRIIAEVDSRLLNIVGSQSQDAALRQQQEVIKNAQEEYFIAFNEHRDPLIAPYIQQAAGELATEFPNLPWNEQYIAALGARVNSKLAAIRGAVPAPPAPPAPAPAPPSPPQPASMMPFGARTGQDAVEQDADLINDTFTWGN